MTRYFMAVRFQWRNMIGFSRTNIARKPTTSASISTIHDELHTELLGLALPSLGYTNDRTAFAAIQTKLTLNGWKLNTDWETVEKVQVRRDMFVTLTRPDDSTYQSRLSQVIKSAQGAKMRLNDGDSEEPLYDKLRVVGQLAVRAARSGDRPANWVSDF